MSDLSERLRERARACRLVSIKTDFFALPPIAQAALYGIAAELDDAEAALEAAEKERDEARAVFEGYGVEGIGGLCPEGLPITLADVAATVVEGERVARVAAEARAVAAERERDEAREQRDGHIVNWHRQYDDLARAEARAAAAEKAAFCEHSRAEGAA